MTLIPRSEFGQTPDALVEANAGRLLHYLLDEDAGWMFAVYSGPLLVSYYECRWLDWSDPEDRIKVDASGVDVEVVWALAQRHGHGRSSWSWTGSCALVSSGGPTRRRVRTTMASSTGSGGLGWRMPWRSSSPFLTMSGSGGGTTCAMLGNG